MQPLLSRLWRPLPSHLAPARDSRLLFEATQKYKTSILRNAGPHRRRSLWLQQVANLVFILHRPTRSGQRRPRGSQLSGHGNRIPWEARIWGLHHVTCAELVLGLRPHGHRPVRTRLAGFVAHATGLMRHGGAEGMSGLLKPPSEDWEK